MEDSASQDAGAAAGGGGGYSDTNVRTEGVDEGDIVKTDGSYIYTLNRSGVLRIVAVDGGDMSVAGQISLDDLTDSIQEMYVDGNTLCVVTSGYDSGLEWQGDDAYMVNSRDFVRLYTYDITDKSKITLKGTVEQDGIYDSTRKVGNYVYLFSQFYPAYKDQVQPAQPRLYVPSVNNELLDSADVLYPAIPQRENGQLVISSVNLEKPDKIQDSKSLIGASGRTYVSTESIYIFGDDYTGEEMHLATEFGYFLADLIFKEKGLKVRETYVVFDRYRHPSFVGFSVGLTVIPGSYTPYAGPLKIALLAF